MIPAWRWPYAFLLGALKAAAIAPVVAAEPAIECSQDDGLILWGDFFELDALCIVIAYDGTLDLALSPVSGNGDPSDVWEGHGNFADVGALISYLKKLGY